MSGFYISCVILGQGAYSLSLGLFLWKAGITAINFYISKASNEAPDTGTYE